MAENKKQWFVVHTYSGYENKVKENLIRRTGTMNMENYIFRVIVPMEDEVKVKDENGNDVSIPKPEDSTILNPDATVDEGIVMKDLKQN